MKSKTGKMLALILALSIVLSLGACGKIEDEPATTTLHDTAVNPGETAIGRLQARKTPMTQGRRP